MSIEELSKLSDEELNVRLAELRGYTFHDVKKHKGEDVYEKFWLRPGVMLNDITADDICYREGTSPPRFSTDLNECAKVEAWLTDKQHATFRVFLFRIVDSPQAGQFVLVGPREYISATARQRTIALILTLQP